MSNPGRIENIYHTLQQDQDIELDRKLQEYMNDQKPTVTYPP